MSRSPLRILLALIAFGVILFVLIQFIPYGRDHTNPPVVKEPKWADEQTRALAKRTCFDCHSNETIWPWYASVAPGSWLVQKDVDDARAAINFSDWLGGSPDSFRDVINNGIMPPPQYLLLHPEAKLSEEEKKMLVDGLTRTLEQE